MNRAVPIIPTDAMTLAGGKALAAAQKGRPGDDYWNANAVWRAMLEAAPEQGEKP